MYLRDIFILKFSLFETKKNQYRYESVFKTKFIKISLGREASNDLQDFKTLRVLAHKSFFH